MSDTHIYKILTHQDWARFQAKGNYGGSQVDLADGYIHFSTTTQLRETLEKHYAGQAELYILAVALTGLPEDKMKWEESRGGQLFPHLYADLPLSAVANAFQVELSPSGQFVLPAQFG